MKRAVLSLLCAGALAGMIAAPASAASTGTFNVTACIDGGMHITATWTDEAPAGTTGTLTFKTQFSSTDVGMSGSSSTDDPGATPTGYFTTNWALPQGDSWDNLLRIKVSTSGYFKASAKVTPGANGWPAC